MEFKTVWIIFEVIILLDLITTFIGITFFGLVEANTTPRFLFSLGWYGWIMVFLIYSCSAFLFSSVPFLVKKITNQEIKKVDRRFFRKILKKTKNPSRLSRNSFYFTIILLALLWLSVPFHNILLIINSP